MSKGILSPLDQLVSQSLVSSVAIVSFLGIVNLNAPAKAQQRLECQVLTQEGPRLENAAQFQYQSAIAPRTEDILQGQTNGIETQVVIKKTQIDTIASGIRDQQGNLVIGFGSAVDSLTPLLSAANLSAGQIEAVSLAAVEGLALLGNTNSLAGAIAQIKAEMAQAVSDPGIRDSIRDLDEAKMALIILGFSPGTLQAMGLPPATVDQLVPTAEDMVRPLINQSVIAEAAAELEAALNNILIEKERSIFAQGRQIWTDTLTESRDSETSNFQPGDTLTYSLTLRNAGKAPGQLTLPALETWQSQAIQGKGTLTSLSYRHAGGETQPIAGNAQTITLAPNETIAVTAEITIGEVGTTTAHSIQFGFGANTNCGGTATQQTVTIVPPVQELGDPFGRVTGCNGEILPNYEGFAVGLYETPDGRALGEVLSLTRTELPDNPDNEIPEGLEPNIENSNPFFLTNGDGGKYNFLLDVNRGQLENGDTYILLVNPPQESIYDERRVRIEIGQRTDDRIPFTATSLDGLPISVTDPLERTILEGTFVVVEDAERLGLNLAVIDFQTSTCQAEEIDLDKFADRAAAEIGDIVLYQLNIRNLSQDPVRSVSVTDLLPVGLNFIDESVRSGIGDNAVDLTVDQNQRNLDFQFVSPPQLPSGETLKIIYGAEVTPDARRGSGVNTASVEAQVRDRVVRDGPVTHELDIRPGLLNDCGTLIGKVFVDKNFDGEQQAGEPGVPNAVIYLEDGSRITTDADGLYSLKNVCPGYHTGILDLTSIPGYELAPNPRRREQRSPSRLFKMSPGAMVRLNFAVTPSAGEEKE